MWPVGRNSARSTAAPASVEYPPPSPVRRTGSPAMEQPPALLPLRSPDPVAVAR